MLDLGREGGHSKNRIVHARDLTGKEVERALLKKVSEIKNIRLFENHTAVDLLTEHQLGMKGKKRGTIHCYGAYILDNTSGVVNTFNAKMILLATGGVGQVYLHTTNPEIATGDGIAMAYRAGALIARHGVHPVPPHRALYPEADTGPSFLISEAVRGEGAILLNTRGERFMERVHPLKDLAPRDIVARAIDMELKKYGVTNVYLDITIKEQKIPHAAVPPHLRPMPGGGHRHLEGADTRRARGPLPLRRRGQRLRTARHRSKTSTSPANRPAPACTAPTASPAIPCWRGSSFPTGPFSRPRSTSVISTGKPPCRDFPNWNKEGTFDLEEWVLVQHDIEDVKRLMWDYVGIVRSDKRLQKAHKRILMLAEDIHDYYRKSTISSRIVELRNLATVAKLIIRSAMARRDSIGLHYNSDHPDTGRQEDERGAPGRA